MLGKGFVGLRSKLFGSREFYRMVLAIALPIMLQDALRNIVGLLDNLMVGQIGTNDMSGVSITNNILFVFTIVCFGAVSGAGIFGAQFFGKGDHEGVAQAFRSKIYICSAVTVAAICLLMLKGEDIIALYLHDSEGSVGDVAKTGEAALAYLKIMLLSLPPLAMSFVYSSTLRECGQTVVPLKAGVAGVLVDLVLNYCLIFGNFGMPALGVKGAAIATVLARVVEMSINIIWTHTHSDEMPFAKYAFASFAIERQTLHGVLIKGLPLLVNEALWVLSISATMTNASSRGLTVVAALNINSTLANVFNIAYLALGSAVSIIVGQKLGAGQIDEAKDSAIKLITFSAVVTIGTSVLNACCAPFFPYLYNTEPEVRALATQIILLSSCFYPFQAICNSSYYALRSGGKTWLTFIFDSGLQWTYYVPVSYFLYRFTALPMLLVFAIVSCNELIKMCISLAFLHKVNWAVNIVDESEI